MLLRLPIRKRRAKLLWPGMPLAVASSLVASLLAPLQASATTASPTVLTGTVYLPDGHTPAPAAAVDLMLADPVTGEPVAGSAFARGVSGLDGSFAVDPPERPDLVAAAEQNGGTLPIAIQIGKLAPHGSIDPNASGPDPLTGKTASNPDVAYWIGSQVMTLVEVETAGNPIVEFNFVYYNPAGLAVAAVLAVAGTAARTALIIAMYKDPDFVTGKDDVNDPDLVPPLGADLDIIPVTEAAATELVPQTGIVDAGTAGTAQTLADTGTAAMGNEDGEESGNVSSGCGIRRNYTLPTDGQNPPNGTKYRVNLRLYHCADVDDDPDQDFYAWAWKGKITNVDQGTTWVNIWRFKFRTELTSRLGYGWDDVDPETTRGDGSWSLHWEAGWNNGPVATVSGSYTVVKAKKIHEYDDWDGKLFHVSWISNKNYGSHSSDFWNGGGMAFHVPQDEENVQLGATNSIHVWRCWQAQGESVGCDPRQ